MSSPRTHQWFRLEAVDAWFFRDGKPFNRGEDQGDFSSLFPPAACTTSGTMRYALAIENGWNGRGSWCGSTDHDGNDLENALGDGPEKTGQLSFDGPLVCRDGKPLFAMPRHVLGYTETKRDQGATFEQSFCPLDWLVPRDIGHSDVGNAKLPVALGVHQVTDDKWPKQAEEFFLTHQGMQAVVAGNLPGEDECLHHSRLFEMESRVGIQRDPQRKAVREGSLYNPHFIRLQTDVGLMVGVDGIPAGWKVPDLIAFGGEARMSGLVETTSSVTFEKQPSLSNTQAAVIALTPAFFQNPWWGAGPGQPASQLCRQFTGVVSSVAIDRPQRIGGWNSVAGGPLPKRAFAPAGSVWWIDSDDDLLPGTVVYLGQNNHLGYGMAVVAAISKKSTASASA